MCVLRSPPWLLSRDSNPDHEGMNLVCYHYTTQLYRGFEVSQPHIFSSYLYCLSERLLVWSPVFDTKDLVGFMFHNHAYATPIRTRLLRHQHTVGLLAGVGFFTLIQGNSTATYLTLPRLPSRPIGPEPFQYLALSQPTAYLLITGTFALPISHFFNGILRLAPPIYRAFFWKGQRD